MKICGYEVHPAAARWPMMEEERFNAFVADIAARGLLEPIKLYNGAILDGRNRILACKKAGVDPRFTNADPRESPFLLSISLNGHRRDVEPIPRVGILAALTADDAGWQSEHGPAAIKARADAARSEKAKGNQNAAKNSCGSRDPQLSAMAKAGAAKAAERGGSRDPQGSASEPRSRPDDGHASRRALAEAAGVSTGTVARWDALEKKAPSVAKALVEGKIDTAEANIQVRAIKEKEREAKRQENAEAVAAAPSPRALVGKQVFSTIVLDPPWDWGDEGDADQLGRARPTYQTMPIGELMKLPVAALAAKNSHVYLWITNRSLPKGFALLDAWGFRYITTLTWCKPSIGMGNYFRGSTEQILFGVRGSLALKRKDIGTWFAARRPGRHSTKPPESYELIESCSPAPYLEMFSRSGRKGWTVWGAEANG